MKLKPEKVFTKNGMRENPSTSNPARSTRTTSATVLSNLKVSMRVIVIVATQLIQQLDSDESLIRDLQQLHIGGTPSSSE